MKRRETINIGWMAAAAALVFMQPARGSADELRQAVRMAVEDARDSLAKSGLPRDRGLAVLPLTGDRDRYVEGLLKTAVTDAGLKHVEGGRSPFWDEILREVEWAERKEDMLAPETAAKFGKLEGVRMLLYGTLRSARRETHRVFVEIELHVSDIETGRHLWGTAVSRRFYLPGAVQGIVDLDTDARNAIDRTIEKGLESLKGSDKLGEIRTVAMVPLAGDIDSYVGGRVQDMVSRTRLNPKNLDLPTLGEARQLMRDRPEQADAVLYGALRDLSRRLVREETMRTTHEVSAEIQLVIQSASTGEVLWSDTLRHVEEVTPAKPGEEAVVELTRRYPRLWLYLGGGLLGLIVLSIIVKKATRVR